MPREPGRARVWTGRQVARVAQRLLHRSLLPVDFLPEVRPRWGWGAPPHDRLKEVLVAGHEAYRANLETFTSYIDDMARIERLVEYTIEPWWLSRWLPALDAAAIYAFVRSREPRNYVEIGSGVSTLFAARAVRDGGLETRITSIEPFPWDAVGEVSDRLYRQPLETVDLSVFSELGEGDVLFMDGSHRVFTNSDATVFFLEVLPELPAGVLVGIHDILLPDDYLPEWTGYYWSEQYLLAAWLLGGARGVRLELAARYVTEYTDLADVMLPLWESRNLRDVDRRGFALWMTTAG